MRTKCISHCATCGEHFAGDAAFDAHRAGDASRRYCREPWKVLAKDGAQRLVVKTDEATCPLGDPPRVLSGVTLWATAGWDQVSSSTWDTTVKTPLAAPAESEAA